jgi:proton glutamate symport protein
MVTIVASVAGTASPELLTGLKKIQEQGTLRIGIMEMPVPPFVFEKNGILSGYDVDICRNMAASLGVRPIFIKVKGSFDEVIQAISAGEVDIGMCELSKTAKRSKTVYYSHTYFVAQNNIIVNRLTMARAGIQLGVLNNTGFEGLKAQFSKPEFKIATLSHSSFIPLVDTLFPAAHKIPFTSWEEVLSSVSSGEADVGVLSASSYAIMVNSRAELFYKIANLELTASDPLAIAVCPKNPDLLGWINDYLETNVLNQEVNMQQLIKTYLVEDKSTPLQEDTTTEPNGKLKNRTNQILLIFALHLLIVFILWGAVIRKKGTRHWLLSPWAVLAGMLLGGITGANFPNIAEFFSRPAAIYMGFWRMCILPIMVTIVITSVHQLLTNKNNSILVKKLLFWSPIILIVSALIGVAFGVLGQPGANFPEGSQKVLVTQMETGLNVAGSQGLFNQLMDIVANIVPDNIFRPVVNSQNLGVLFVAVLFGIALAHSKKKGTDTMVYVLDTILDVFTKMINASLYLLPFALYALCLDFMAQTGMELLVSILKLITWISLAFIPGIVLPMLILSLKLKIPIKTIFEKFGAVYLISFSARSSIISMPLALEALGECPQVDKERAMIAYPFVLLVCHYGYAVFFAIIPVFIAQVFGIDLTLFQYLSIAVLAVLVTLASMGSIGLSHILLFSIICRPLGLPLEPTILVGMAVFSIIDPLASGNQTFFSCGTTAWLAAKPVKNGE